MSAGIKANADGSAAIQVGGSDAITITSGLDTTFVGTVTSPTGTLYPLVSGTAVTASGTSVNFTGIPSTAKRITVMLYDVSTSGSSAPQIQIGSGSFTVTGYTSVGQNGTTVQSSTSGFITTGSWAGTSIKSGAIVLNSISSTVWVASGVSIDIPAGNASYCAGRVTIGGALDRVRIRTVNGTDTFNAGIINILWE